jgi:hypothetical protein
VLIHILVPFAPICQGGKGVKKNGRCFLFVVFTQPVVSGFFTTLTLKQV